MDMEITATNAKPECLVHRSEYGRNVASGPIKNSGNRRGQFLLKSVAATGNRYAKTMTAAFDPRDLVRCGCGCEGSFVVAPERRFG